MDILIKIAQLFLCFTILVGIHELGHFLMARAFKIRVEKFYIFFDPWFSLFKFKRGDTEYGLGWLPLGGYVKIAGMIDESMDKEQMKQPVKPDEFRAKPAWQRLLVMVAGVMMNVLLAIVIYCAVCYTWGDSYFSNQDAILVGIHELGHFLMARAFKIRVEKFYIFFDPWFSLFKFKRGDTEYGLGWLPLGGYVKIAGMIDESMDKEQMKQPVKPDEFRAKPAWQRLLVMVAGVMMNVLLAIVIYCAVCYTWGDSYFSNQDAKWGYNFNPTAHEMGFRDGDRFVSIDGEEIDNVMRVQNDLLITDGGRRVVVERGGEPVTLDIPFESLLRMRQEKAYEDLFTLRLPFIVDSVSYTSAVEAGLESGDEVVAIDDLRDADYPRYRDYLQKHKNDKVLLTVRRDGALIDSLALPVDAEGRIGVTVTNPYSLRTQYYTFWESIPAGIHKAGKTISSYWDQLKLIVQPKTKMYEELGGFVAIGSIFPGSWDWHDFWLKTAFLSIILAVMNLLPIPGLDGGHALFTLWEIITRRKPSEKFLEVAQYVGLMIILALLVYANGNDIYRFFIK